MIRPGPDRPTGPGRQAVGTAGEGGRLPVEPAVWIAGVERRRGRSWQRVVGSDGRAWVVDHQALVLLGFLPDDPAAFPVPAGQRELRLLEEAEQGTARRRLLSLLAHRDRSRQELHRLLALWPFPEACVREAVQWACSLGYVDDEALAAEVIRQGRSRSLGRRALLHHLEQRGIQPTVAHQALTRHLPAEAELSQATGLARRYWRAHAQLGPAARARRAYAALLRRGYEEDLARRALRAALAAEGAELPELSTAE